jgi:hypothetical protein
MFRDLKNNWAFLFTPVYRHGAPISNEGTTEGARSVLFTARIASATSSRLSQLKRNYDVAFRFTTAQRSSLRIYYGGPRQKRPVNHCSRKRSRKRLLGAPGPRLRDKTFV